MTQLTKIRLAIIFSLFATILSSSPVQATLLDQTLARITNFVSRAQAARPSDSDSNVLIGQCQRLLEGRDSSQSLLSSNQMHEKNARILAELFGLNENFAESLASTLAGFPIQGYSEDKRNHFGFEVFPGPLTQSAGGLVLEAWRELISDVTQGLEIAIEQDQHIEEIYGTRTQRGWEWDRNLSR